MMSPWEGHCTTGRLKESLLQDLPSPPRARVAASEDTGKGRKWESTARQGGRLTGLWGPGQALLLPTEKLHLSQTDVHIHIRGL